MIKGLWLLSSWAAPSVAKEDSSTSESSLSTGKVSSDPDIKAAESQPSVRALSEEQQAAVGAGKARPDVQASQHYSGFPVTLDCTHVHVQHCSPAPASLPLHCPPPPPPPAPQPPSYAQSLAKSQFCHPETLFNLPAYTSVPMVTQPPRVTWTAVSAGSNTVSTAQPSQELRRIQSYATSTSGSGAASSVQSATHIYSQKLSRPTSAGQGKPTATLLCAALTLCLIQSETLFIPGIHIRPEWSDHKRSALSAGLNAPKCVLNVSWHLITQTTLRGGLGHLWLRVFFPYRERGLSVWGLDLLISHSDFVMLSL